MLAFFILQDQKLSIWTHVIRFKSVKIKYFCKQVIRRKQFQKQCNSSLSDLVFFSESLQVQIIFVQKINFESTKVSFFLDDMILF